MSYNARLFTDEEELMIGYIYRDGATMNQIAEKYPCTAATVMHIVKRAGLKTRSKDSVSDQDRDQAISLYKSGLTAPEVGRKIGWSTSVIYRILHDEDIKPSDLMRRGIRGKANRRFTDEEEMVIGDIYKDGASLNQLAKKYDVSLITIRNALIRQDIPRRERGNIIRAFTDDEVQEIAKQWHEGKSQTSIAEDFDTHQTVISRTLKLHGIESKARYASGEKHGRWKGGRYRGRGGYIFVQVDADSPFAEMCNTQGYVQEHRLVMAEQMGRPLKSWETVHHINDIKDDNKPKNLQLRIGRHGKGIVYRCMECGSKKIEPIEL